MTELEKSNHLMEANLGKLKDELEGLEGEGVMQQREALGEDDTMYASSFSFIYFSG